MSTEHQRIARIRALFSRPNPAISLGIGDDCAVLARNASPLVWTIDAAIENVHFSRAFMRDAQIGYRAFMAAASDIAAMGAQGSAALCALAFPAEYDDLALDALLTGIAEASDALALPVVGGNLARAAELSITTTVLGACERPITRAGALPGHGIFVSGSIGGAALGLASLRGRLRHDVRFSEARERFLRPRARLDLSGLLALHASAAIDISDGLAQDLGHLCESAGVAAELELARIPRIAQFDELAHLLGLTPATLLLGGGEDFELLFTAPPEAVPPELGTRIGTIEAGSGLRVRDARGVSVAIPEGFDHFR